MRAGIKYFVEQRGKKALCVMYQDTDFGKDVLAGVTMQAEVQNAKIVATTAHGQASISIAQIALQALRRAGRDLTVDSLASAMESLHEFTDLYGNTYSFGPNQHHGSTKAFLAVVKDGRWVPVADKPLGY